MRWFWLGPDGDLECRGKCCPGPRLAKQVLCQHALAGQRGPIGALEQSSGARWRSEKVQEGRRREHRWRHRRVAGEVLVTGPMRASRGAEGGDGGGLGPAMWTFVHKRVLWTYVHKAYLWAIAARSEEA